MYLTEHQRSCLRTDKSLSKWFCAEKIVHHPCQVIEVHGHIGRDLDRGKQIDVFYLDMSKAYDKISHAKLLHRLREFGFLQNHLPNFQESLSSVNLELNNTKSHQMQKLMSHSKAQ